MATKIIYIENAKNVQKIVYVLAEEVAEYLERDGNDITILNIEECGA